MFPIHSALFITYSAVWRELSPRPSITGIPVNRQTFRFLWNLPLSIPEQSKIPNGELSISGCLNITQLHKSYLYCLGKLDIIMRYVF